MYLNYLKKNIKKINKLESYYKTLSDKNLKLKTKIFKLRIKKGENIFNLLPESYALVREASFRILGLRHFDVQIMGGIVLNFKCVAEMHTGEGKTLTSTLPIYLNSLEEKGVHVVTTNDYLAKRDAENNKLLFNFLGLSVGINLSGMNLKEKKKAYFSDITYGSSSEYVFDYLKDNMVLNFKNKVQRSLNFALLDEIDSILIDEARTPIIISNKLEYNILNKKKHIEINNIIKFLLKNRDYIIDKKNKQIYLSELGYKLLENIFLKKGYIKKKKNLYNYKNIILLNYVISLLKAYYLYKKDVDYVIYDNKIIIVDENTGRLSIGKRWSNLLHQSIEIKENVKVKENDQILNSITFQNYFLLYKKLSGMTGTAYTEYLEFNSIYGLKTIIIPTNKPVIRKDNLDLIYVTRKEKIKAIVNKVIKCLNKKQPILIGTNSIKSSFIISKNLNKLGINHNILNAKFHEYEANIISEAGKPGNVTIATNIAGRGINIILGGTNKKYNKMVLKSGGLYVIGSERNESRRIDNQLRGRSGRQGEPGSSKFYISLQDNLIKFYISKNLFNFFKKINIYGKSIKNKLINKIIFNIQKKIENKNFNIRKELFKYDNIINKQRLFFFKKRNLLLKLINFDEFIFNNIKYVLNDLIKLNIVNKYFYNIFKKKIKNYFNLKLSLKFYINLKYKIHKKSFLFSIILNNIFNIYIKKIKIFGFKILNIKRKLILRKMDFLWKEHLINLNNLKEIIYLRTYINKDPIKEYKNESYIIFMKMIKILNYKIINILFKI